MTTEKERELEETIINEREIIPQEIQRVVSNVKELDIKIERIGQVCEKYNGSEKIEDILKSVDRMSRLIDRKLEHVLQMYQNICALEENIHVLRVQTGDDKMTESISRFRRGRKNRDPPFSKKIINKNRRK